MLQYRRVSTLKVRFMVFYATFNNISVISWRSVLLVDETGYWQTLSHGVSITPHHERDLNSQLVVKGTDCTGSCKSNYHTITTALSTVNKQLYTWHNFIIHLLTGYEGNSSFIVPKVFPRQRRGKWLVQRGQLKYIKSTSVLLNWTTVQFKILN